jgi:hypothetical protein
VSDAACGPHRRAFTLVFCGACGATAAGRARGVLRRAVRDCPHGVLAFTDCLEKVRTADVAAGCTPPHSRARSTAGPPGASCAWLRSRAKPCAEAIGAWLRAGLPDDGMLPDRLRAAPSPSQIARLN